MSTNLIGPLRIDHSTAVQVQQFAGPADYIGAASYRPLIHQFAPSIALGYGCRHVRSGGIPTVPIKPASSGDSHVSCQTLYLVNQRTNKLAAFWTTSRRFHTVAGVRVRTTLATAAHREPHARWIEDPRGLNVHARIGDMLIYASWVRKHGQWLIGKTVWALSVESNRHPVGFQFV